VTASSRARLRGGACRRSALHTLGALLALLAIGAIAVLVTATSAGAQAGEQTTAPEPTEAPSPTATGDAPPSDLAPQPPAAVQSQDPPAESSPTPPQWEPHATYHAPPSAGAPPSTPDPTPAPSEGASPDGVASEPPTTPDGESETPTPPGGTVAAQNVGTVLQAIWQVQVGCRTYCNGTSQSQLASQQSDTTQSATAVAQEGHSSGAAAVNQSSTVQFVWQTQLGCVAFCWNTSMNQSASQDAQTTQMASAVSDFGVLAENIAESIQFVWQLQEGCQVECYGVNESQSLSQRQSTTQSATATGPRFPTSAGPSADGAQGFFSWLTAFARNIDATIQWIYQFQEASCLEHCGDEALLQAAWERTTSSQTSTAGDVPEPGADPPTGSEPPPTSERPPAAEQPPGSEPRPAGSGSQAAPAMASVANEALAGGGELGSERPRGDQSILARAEGRVSTHVSSRRSETSLIATTEAGAGDSAAPVSATSEIRSRLGAQMSTSGGETPADQRTRASSHASSVAATLDQSAASESRNEPFPWLPALLLAIAGMAVIQTLRVRPGFGA
jgi:hypothetical protein